MKHISILVPRGAVALSTIECSYTILNKVNDFLQIEGKEPVFHIELVGLTKEPVAYHSLFTVTPTKTIAEVRHTDLVIIPAINGDMNQVIKQNRDFISWMKDRHNEGAELASLCVGAFVLAATGLLKGRKCATHWQAVSQFRTMFPDVELVSEKIITDEMGIYSSGGANSFLNLIIYLIEKHAGRKMAVFCSKVFEIEMDRDSQQAFIIFERQKSHEDDVVKKAQQFIEQNYQEKITVDQLASMLSLSRRNLERRFKKATSNTAIEYLQRVKIEAAKQSLESSKENINEVMYKVGYNDHKAFRSTFKRHTGLSPVQYRKRFNREASRLAF